MITGYSLRVTLPPPSQGDGTGTGSGISQSSIDRIANALEEIADNGCGGLV